MKQKTCRVCKHKFEPVRFAQVVCCIKCAVKHVAKKTAAKIKKQKDQVKKNNAQQKRAFKTNDVSHQKELTQAIFNRMRRLQELKWFRDRGREPECISCGKINMDWCCGHFKTVGSSGSLRYEPANTYLQCNKYCNMSKSGNIEGCKNTRGFKQGLTDRFGWLDGEVIIDWCNTNQSKVKKWTGAELIEMRKEFNKQIRELEREQ